MQRRAGLAEAGHGEGGTKRAYSDKAWRTHGCGATSGQESPRGKGELQREPDVR